MIRWSPLQLFCPENTAITSNKRHLVPGGIFMIYAGINTYWYIIYSVDLIQFHRAGPFKNNNSNFSKSDQRLERLGHVSDRAFAF